MLFISKPLSTLAECMLMRRLLIQEGAGCRMTNHVIRGLQLSAPTTSGGGERGCRLSLTTNGRWFNDSCLCNEASITTPNNVVWRASRMVNTSRCWEGAEPERAGSSAFLPHTLPYVSFPSLVLSYILYNKPERVSKAVS